MRWRVLLWTLAATLVASTVSAQTGAAPDNAVRVQVNLVNVPVNVVGREGQPVTGLHRDDFSLTEDGHPETIRVFQPTAVHPLSMVLAIDTSASVRKDLPSAKQAAENLAASLLDHQDQVELLGFSGDVTQVVPFTANRHQFDHGLRSLSADGPTALYSAITRAANDLASRPGRKVIVVISDGSNSVDGVDYDQARKAALRAQASIESIILIPIGSNAGRDLGGEHALIQLSNDTGGQYFYADGADPLHDAVTRLSLALRSEYLLGYYPTQQPAPDGASGHFHTIQLRFANPALNRMYHLHYRTGYYSGGMR